MTSPPRAKPEEKKKTQRERKNMKTIPVRFPQETKKRKKSRKSGLTSVRVRINESGLLVRSITTSSEAASLSV